MFCAPNGTHITQMHYPKMALIETDLEVDENGVAVAVVLKAPNMPQLKLFPTKSGADSVQTVR